MQLGTDLLSNGRLTEHNGGEENAQTHYLIGEKTIRKDSPQDRQVCSQAIAAILFKSLVS